MNKKTFVDPDFKKVFKNGPGLHLILDPRLYIIAASDAWLHATGIRREKIIGRYVFEALPDNPDYTRKARNSTY